MVRAGVTYATVYGAILIGVMINLCLEGIGLLLVLQYFRRYAKKDPIIIKGTIAVMIILATLQSMFSSIQVYDIFITKQGDIKRLNQIIYAVPGYWICGYFTAFTAEIFFCHRIWIKLELTKSVFFRAVDVGFDANRSTSHTYSQMAKKTPFLVSTTIVQGSGAALSDIIISATLCWIFHKNRSEIRRTNSMINKLITYAINRAIATGSEIRRTNSMINKLITYAINRAIATGRFIAGGSVRLTKMFTIVLFCRLDVLFCNLFIRKHTSLTTREHLRELGDPSFHVTNLELQFNTVKSKSEGGVDSAIGETTTGTGSGTGSGIGLGSENENESKSTPDTVDS
ncbi:hypothetical protein CPB83DRAFT_840454 [Crepidotus variabilis]|uniref:DUF6534 domain-containing protein n=1 Tax=Crepidotus variabilis TaxID=179855 RepID=A0A9P6E4S1_9AGAR|nr:hypothetical protein CPB83DRAFT_840454 [Crepidotus variabilis]